MRARHAAYYLTLAQAAEVGVRGSEQRAWLDRLEAEQDNLRAALQWAMDRLDSETALRLTSALCQFWTMRGHLYEGGRWLETALALPAPGASAAGVGIDSRVRAKALAAAGAIALDQGHHDQAVARLQEALTIQRRLDDRRGAMVTLAWLGSAASEMDDLDRAELYFRESLDMAREEGIADDGTAAFVLCGLGDMARLRDDYGLATVLLQESLTLWRQVDNPYGISCALCNLGLLAVAQRDYQNAMPLLQEELSRASEAHYVHHAIHALAGLAKIAAESGQVARAVRLLGHVAMVIGTTGNDLIPGVRAVSDRIAAGARSQLGEAEFAVAWAAGRAMSPEEAVQEALLIDDRNERAAHIAPRA